MITLGKPDAPYIVVCDPPQASYNKQNPTTAGSLKLFIDEAKKAGFSGNDFFFIQLCEPIPDNIKKSDSKTWKFVLEHLDFLNGHLESRGDRPVITMGALATRAVVGRPTSITKCRGTLLENKVFPILSPAHCLRIPENLPIFQADIQTLKLLSNKNFEMSTMGAKKNNWWCYNLDFLFNDKPKVIAVDTETTGLRTTDPTFEILTVQIAYNEVDVAVIPVHEKFWPKDLFSLAKLNALKAQVKLIMEDPTIRKVGQNINYERAAFRSQGVIVKGWLADTQLLAATIDENMYSKSIDDIARRFVPEEAGFNDTWNETIDKTDMINCPYDSMLDYGGNDARVTLKAFWILWELLKVDPKQYNLFVKLKMPGLLAFHTLEYEGIKVDLDYLNSIKIEAKNEVEALHKRLIDSAPRAVLRKHMEEWELKKKKDNPLRLSRDALVRDILFSKEGFNLKPIVFTDGTKDDPDPTKRLPSVSSKQHLPYFTELDGEAGEFVIGLIEYAKLEKLNSTYIQKFEASYVHHDGKIHSQFHLHRVNTGRTSSSGPNTQNFPARGVWSKKYKKAFVAKPGYRFISADLSQIELRLVAWESQDPVMLAAYRAGKDIHKITAMAVSGHTEETWDLLSKDEQKLLRYRAKAVNFGFIYGMRAKKFRSYARTDYGVKLTEAEALQYYSRYHNLYKGIGAWHKRRIREVRDYGYVTSLHGYIRNLPSIYSNDSAVSSGAERNAINAPIQGLGSDLGVLAIARINRQVDPDIICPVAFIHDDVILQVKIGHEEEAVNMLLWVLANPPLKTLFDIESPIPIYGEPDIGTSLGSMMELYDLPEDAPEEYKLLATKIKPAKPSWWDDAKDIK